LDGSDFKTLRSFDLKHDADNLRFDAARNQVYAGYGSGGIAIIDVLTGEMDSGIKFSAHPEGFQVTSTGNRIFVNVPESREILVLDPEKKMVASHWPTDRLRANFPMELDEANHRLFVGFREPPVLSIYDSETGKNLAQLPIDSDIDDIAYDARRKWLLLTCGSGYADAWQQTDPDHYRSLGRIPTAKGARTGLYDPESGRLYVAAPAHGGREAGILVFNLN